MSKRILAFILIALVALSIEACTVGQFFANPNSVQGSGLMSSETRAAAGFDRIRITGLGSADIQVGETEGLQIEAEDNILPFIETSVQNGVLVIGTRANTNLNITRDIHYTIQVKSLSGLEFSGATLATVSGPVRAAAFRIVLTGTGSLTVPDLQAQSLSIKCDGTGCAKLAGQVGELKAELNGTGELASADLQCSSADITSQGIGSATLWVKDTLDAKVSGLGSVRYYGQPSVTQATSEMSHLVALGGK